MNTKHEPQNSPWEPAKDVESSAEGSERGREYVRPAILSHSGEEILEELGPAQACYSFTPWD